MPPDLASNWGAALIHTKAVELALCSRERQSRTFFRCIKHHCFPRPSALCQTGGFSARCISPNAATFPKHSGPWFQQGANGLKSLLFQAAACGLKVDLRAIQFAADGMRLGRCSSSDGALALPAPRSLCCCNLCLKKSEVLAALSLKW